MENRADTDDRYVSMEFVEGSYLGQLWRGDSWRSVNGSHRREEVGLEDVAIEEGDGERLRGCVEQFVAQVPEL